MKNLIPIQIRIANKVIIKYIREEELNYSSLIRLKKLLIMNNSPSVPVIDKIIYDRVSCVQGRTKGRGMRGKTKIKLPKRRKVYYD